MKDFVRREYLVQFKTINLVKSLSGKARDDKQ